MSGSGGAPPPSAIGLVLVVKSGEMSLRFTSACGKRKEAKIKGRTRKGLMIFWKEIFAFNPRNIPFFSC